MNIELTIPDGKQGDWTISTVNVPPPHPLTVARAMLRGGGRIVPQGVYKILKRNETIVMSNTPDELRDFRYFLSKASGSILINGLGLGVLVQGLLNKPEVTEITVIEKSIDVIKLVGPHYLKDSRVTIINECCFDYSPPKGKRYNFIWHDIWDYITSDNLPEMKKLHRKYGRKTDHQFSWCREICERNAREDKRNGWY
jgi:hypothetical protein